MLVKEADLPQKGNLVKIVGFFDYFFAPASSLNDDSLLCRKHTLRMSFPATCFMLLYPEI